MVFGFSNKNSAGSPTNAAGGSGKSRMSGLREAVSNEGALSERMRLGHITEERHRIESDRAKQGLEEKKRQLQHDRMELSSHEAELRRVTGELRRAEQSNEVIKAELNKLLEEYNASKEGTGAMEKEMESLRVRIAHIKNEMDQQRTYLSRLESQKTYKELEVEKRRHSEDMLKQKKMREENEIRRLHADIVHLESDIKRLGSVAKRE